MQDKIGSFTEENAFLSNFWPVRVIYEGKVYPSVEHAYQAAKTIDNNQRALFLTYPPSGITMTAGQAKRAGKKITLRQDWEYIKINVMRELNYQKYEVPYLKEKLLSTGNKTLEEGNHWGDTFWGICKGQGQNILGKLLMEIRDNIKQESVKVNV